MNFGEKSIYNNWYDIFFVCFPIWIPFSLYIFYQVLPENGAIIFLFALFFFAETHFGVTWLFFFDSNNKIFIKNNLIIFVVLPVLILLASVIIWNSFGISKLVLIASIASAFHVTRQSVGINKLFGNRNQKSLIISNYSIYAFSLLFLVIGFFRFFTNITLPHNYLMVFQLTLLTMVICITIYLFIFLKENKIQSNFI